MSFQAKGCGKTQLLYAIGHELKQAAQVPLYIRVSDYAPHAGSTDVLHFAATQGGFGKLYRSDDIRREFEAALVEAQQASHLVLLADQCDDLFEGELAVVSRHLRDFQRIIVAERTPRLLLARDPDQTISMPRLSMGSIVNLVVASEAVPAQFEQVVTSLSQRPASVTPGLAIVAAHSLRDTGDRHPVTFIGQWIDRLLRETRAVGQIAAEVDKARRLLRYLAGIRASAAPHPEQTAELTRENVRRAFWEFLPVEQEDIGWQLIDLVERSGILANIDDQWTFVDPLVESLLAAEYALSDIPWTSLHPAHHDLMRRLSALLARRGSKPQKDRFFKQLRTALGNASPLSHLDVADYLIEFRNVGTPVDSHPTFAQKTHVSKRCNRMD